MRPHQRLVPNAARLAALLCVGVVAIGSGCKTKPLLSPDHERSQFDRYDRSRDQYASQYVFDEFGRRRPNLSGRLLPRE